MTGPPALATDLVVTPFTPTVDRGRALRTYGVIAALAHHREVDVLFKRFGAAQPSAEYGDLGHVTLHPVEPASRLSRARLYARARLAGVPPADARGLCPVLGRAAAEAASAPARGRVVADGPTAGALMWQLGVDFVYLAHNVESSLRPHLPGFRRGYGSVRLLRRFERKLLLAARESWMVSERDLALARELAPQAALRYVPNVVDVSSIPPAPVAVSAPRALLVGDFGYPPNRHAARFMIDEVMPRVWPRLPGAELVLAGHDLVIPPGTDARVKSLGFVRRIDDAYAQAACVVVPLLEGGGSPVKFIEALAHALPVVATGRAAAGLRVDDGVHYRRADAPQQFADALVDVLRNGASDLGRRGRQLTEARYSVEALADILRP